MRRVLGSLMILAPASPALSAVQGCNHPSQRIFSAGPASILRRLLPAFALMSGLLSPALAADYDLPILRGSSQPVAPIAPVTTVGPATFTRWSGFYLGGQFGYNEANANFADATQPLVHFSLRELALENVDTPSQWAVLGRGSGSAFNGGGFVGYNTQWQDLIIGVEGNYTRTNLVTNAPTTPIGRVTSAGGASYSVFLSGAGSLDLTDYATLRARAGWILGDFLPYGFAGFAVGRASYSVTTLVSGQQSTATGGPPFPNPDGTCTPSATCINYSYSNSDGQNGALLYGLSVGVGLDWAMTQNIFLRSEFEFIQFAPLANINVSIVGARVGGGLKF